MSEVLAGRAPGPTDEDLLSAARGGDREAVTQLYRRHHADLVRYARRFVRSVADAEDVSADALLRMMVALDAGRGPLTNVGAYLRTTVRRLAIDLAGRNALSLPAGLEAGEGAATPEPDGEPALHAAFAALPPRWRDVLWRVDVLGYRPQDLAAESGISPAAACSLLWRARTALRRQYDELRTGTAGDPGAPAAARPAAPGPA
ncbi:RNA polymerase sigma factor [Amycolatopsis viridis]|uniref:RNA polymerase sigma factor (Sigma-70 family) n=1 Tax=Amycolatopsis viridis TaxID=185678 RepID=A0ABX0SVH4_9PSEU|nr:RNA polymerase sigma factor [Amycolatopsis viridis]NIH80971.1 RNA polymerase sigma factor (sigma-70 family) [Amycolatopsis viridis]